MRVLRLTSLALVTRPQFDQLVEVKLPIRYPDERCSMVCKLTGTSILE